MGKGKEVEYKGKKMSHDELASILLTVAVCEFIKTSGKEPNSDAEGFHEGLMGMWLNEMREADAEQEVK